MVNVISDQRTWEVVHTFKNDECPHLYYPANYHGCRLLPIDKDYCTLENCRHLSEAPTRPNKLCDCPEPTILEKCYCTKCGRDMDYAISTCDICGKKFPFDHGTILLPTPGDPIYACPECVEKQVTHG